MGMLKYQGTWEYCLGVNSRSQGNPRQLEKNENTPSPPPPPGHWLPAMARVCASEVILFANNAGVDDFSIDR